MCDNRFIRRLKRLAKDQSGFVAMTFGLALPILILCVSLSMDLGRGYMARSAILAAADPAALASALEDGTTPPAQKYFEANLPTGYLGIDYDFATNVDVVVQNGAVRIVPTGFNVTSFFNSPLTSLGSAAGLNVGGASAASLPTQAATGIAHFALILDVSGSMGGSKIQGLRDATNTLIDLLEEANNNAQNGEELLMSIVTYSSTKKNDIDPTTDIAALHAFANAMVANGNTNCQEGLYWARTQQLGDMPADENKFAVFMSDGECNTVGTGTQSQSPVQAAIYECNGNPDQGIKPQFSPNVSVWTIAFGGGSQQVMQQCASSPDQALFASTNQELEELFSSIFETATTMRLVE